MLPEKYRCAVIVSKAPLIQRGFVAIMDDAFSEYEVVCCSAR